MAKVKKAQDGSKVKSTYTSEKPGDRSKRYTTSYSVDTTGYAAGKKKFPATKEVSVSKGGGPSQSMMKKETSVGKGKVKRMMEKPSTSRVNRKHGGKISKKK